MDHEDLLSSIVPNRTSEAGGSQNLFKQLALTLTQKKQWSSVGPYANVCYRKVSDIENQRECPQMTVGCRCVCILQSRRSKSCC